MTHDMSPARRTVQRTLEEAAHFEDIGALLGWDQEVNLPTRAAEMRAARTAFVAAESHRRTTSPEFLDALRELTAPGSTLSEPEEINLKILLKDAERDAKLPTDFVAAQSALHSKGYDTWERAKPNDDFETIAPLLEQIIEGARKEAEYVGFEGSPYNALLDTYEPFARIAEVRPVLLELAEQLAPRVRDFSSRHHHASGLGFTLTNQQQLTLCNDIVAALGFDFSAGHLGESMHPFQSSCGPYDQRMTVAFRAEDPLDGLYSALHEAGHGLYEQGLPKEYYGQPLGSAASLGWHESQSRFWENIIGRSPVFAKFLGQRLQTLFPEIDFTASDPKQLWKSRNQVSPGLVRITADEVTYNLHIVIRTLLEVDLVEGTLPVKDLPERWSDLYEQYLGIRPTRPSEGALQDPHWYCGLVGYFPTYSLGNLYSAALWDKLRADLGSVDADIESGSFGRVLGWQKSHVHQHGRRYSPEDLCVVATGQGLSAKPFLDYLDVKFGLKK